ncbi:MAG: YebC/PmpR family DNA-binding transcriptional regulator [Myxococcales bacterium]|nr:YebC/PmpR family DNA-binding transcriptional regulator [Myxococcales bacterium]
MGRAFEKRKSTIFARADRMAKLFTRVGRDIAIAVRSGGPTPDANPTLRRVLQNARAANMPKDKIEGAIKKASGQGGADYEIVIYEGYAPHGIAVLVETATDNVTRTVANVRMHFRANGGNFGSTGSVAFLFQRMGVFRLAPHEGDLEELELELIDHGLQELGEGTGDKGEPQLIIRSAFTDFGTLATAIEARGLKLISSASEYVAPTLVELPEDHAKEVLELIDALEGDDDVQAVYHNLA